jgi:long-chain acyl-CoA synthetase
VTPGRPAPTAGVDLTAVDPWPWIERGVSALRAHGLGTGDRVVLVRGSDLATFGLLAAACLEGIVAVPVPPDAGTAEVAAIVADADPRLVVVDPEVGRAPEAIEAGTRPVVALTTPEFVTLPASAPGAGWPRTRPMAYTSGTTGPRKGVSSGVHPPSWGEQLVADELAAFARRHGDVHLVVAPLHHAAPFRFALVTALTGGRIAVLPRFDAASWRAALRAVRPTSTFCVPTHLYRLLALPELVADDLASLTLLAHAGAPCPVAVKEHVLQLAPAGTVWEFYGATEGQFTVAPPELWQASPGTVGVARPDRRVTIRDADGHTVPAGRVGTVWAHVDDHARFEYWRDPRRTAAAWDGDAFTVGDLGRQDAAGRLWLAGRPGDLVITGGVNVYPAEVERALLAQPGVAEAVAFGVPDDEWGERLLAAVVPWPDTDLDGEALREALRVAGPRARVPARILVVGGLPRTPMGKVRREGLADHLGLGVGTRSAGPASSRSTRGRR